MDVLFRRYKLGRRSAINSLQHYGLKMSGITKETFKEADADTKLDILFDYVKDIYSTQTAQIETCNKRFKKIEKRKVKDTVVACSLGLIGGFAAVIAKLKIWG